MSLPGLPSALTSVGSIDDGRRGTGRVGSLSEKKIAQQLRGKDGTVEDSHHPVMLAYFLVTGVPGQNEIDKNIKNLSKEFAPNPCATYWSMCILQLLLSIFVILFECSGHF